MQQNDPVKNQEPKESLSQQQDKKNLPAYPISPITILEIMIALAIFGVILTWLLSSTPLHLS